MSDSLRTGEARPSTEASEGSPGALAEELLTPVQRFGEAIADKVERWMPNPFLFAIILTYLAAVLAYLSEGSSVADIATSWYEGFWNLLQFAMQMVLILVTGTVVAYHPRVRGMIRRLVALPRAPQWAVVLVGVGSMLTGWVSWGLGLIFGAILAREMGREAHGRGMEVHYPLLAVAGYMGMSLTWGWGLSSSPGLLQATEGNIFIQQGFVDRVIPATEWVFHPYPLILTALGIVYVSVALYLLTPPKRASRGVERFSTAEVEPPVEPVALPPRLDLASSFADKLDNSRILAGVIAGTGVILFVRAFLTEGLGALDLNVFNFGFLMIGILLFVSPSTYQEEFNSAVKGSAGVILLFPFYAGIIGIMTGTGLVTTMTNSLLSIATAENFPVVAWVTAGIMNVFVPSSGGEWAIVGAPMLTAARELGIPYGQLIAAYSVGDAHTNLFNPFWAIPLLAITGLQAREMFGYAITMMLLLVPFLALTLYFLPY